MNVRHLTDNQIQDHLDGLMTPLQASELRSHLRECERCRQQVFLYQKIYAQLGVHEEEPFSQKFEERILSAIQGESLGFLHKQLWQVFAFALAALIFFRVSSLFMSYRPLIQSFQRLATPSFDRSLPRFDLFANWLEWIRPLQVHFPFMASVAAVLVFFLLLDHIMKQVRLRALSAQK